MQMRRNGEFHGEVSERDLHWRPDVPGGRWQPYSAAAVDSGSILGSGRLRYTKNDEVRQSMSVCILPTGAKIEIRPSSDPRHGEVRVIGFGDVVAVVPETPGLTAKGLNEPDGYRLVLKAIGDVPREVTMVMDWYGRGRMELPLPFPARRAAFIDLDGDPLPPGASLAQGSLAGVRAEVIVPESGRFKIQGQYSGSDASAVIRHLGMFEREIPKVDFGHHVMDLAELDEEITERARAE